MDIVKDAVVQFHYHLCEGDGKELETSRTGEPMAILVGYNNIIEGLEKAFIGKSEGDVFSVTLLPKDAYGERSEDSKQRVPIKHLVGLKKPKVGQMVTVQTEQGQRQVTVEKVGRFNVDIDTNHPLAGKTLVFDIEILAVRDATEEEISHKHAHGIGGHNH